MFKFETINNHTKLAFIVPLIVLATLTQILAVTSSANGTGTWGGQDTYRIPIAWCVVRGSPAEANPNIPNPWGGFDRTTDEVLWRRHERVTDNIYINPAGITFRSSVNDALHTSLDFKVIDDPVNIGQPGDMLKPSLDTAMPSEYVRIQHECKDAWVADSMNGQFPGIMAINIRLFVDTDGNPVPLDGEVGTGLCKETYGSNLCRSPYEGHVAVVDNYFTIPDIASGMWNNDPMDQTLGHELGHALSLNHRNDVTALMNPSQQLNSDNRVYNKLLNSQEVNDIRGPVNSPARLIPGTEIDPPNQVLSGDVARTIKIDQIGENNNTQPYEDLAAVEVTSDKRENTITFGHELAGLIPIGKHYNRTDEYWTLVNTDNNNNTGGNATILKEVGAPILNSSGIDLVMVSKVKSSNMTNGLTVNGSAWFINNNKNIMLPSNYTRFDIQTLTVQGHYINGSKRIRIYDTVNTILNNTGLFMNSTEPLVKLDKPFSLQAVIFSKGNITDKFDSEAKSKPLKLSHPLYPQCYILNKTVTAGQNATIGISGLSPNSKIYAQIGPRPVGNGMTNNAGNSTVEFTVPPDTNSGLHLLTIGVEDTAFTADCEIHIRSQLKQSK